MIQSTKFPESLLKTNLELSIFLPESLMASAPASKSLQGTLVAGERNNLGFKRTFAVYIYLTVVSYANGANNSAAASEVCPDLVRTIVFLWALFCKTSDLLPLFARKGGKELTTQLQKPRTTTYQCSSTQRLSDGPKQGLTSLKLWPLAIPARSGNMNALERKVLQSIHTSKTTTYPLAYGRAPTSLKRSVAAMSALWVRGVCSEHFHQCSPVHHSSEQNLWQNCCSPGLGWTGTGCPSREIQELQFNYSNCEKRLF